MKTYIEISAVFSTSFYENYKYLKAGSWNGSATLAVLCCNSDGTSVILWIFTRQFFLKVILSSLFSISLIEAEALV